MAVYRRDERAAEAGQGLGAQGGFQEVRRVRGHIGAPRPPLGVLIPMVEKS
jgi:hypothetical protein